MDILDNIIFDQIRQLSTDPDYKPVSEHKEDNTIIIQQEIRKIDNQISKLIDLYTLDQIPVYQLQQKIDDLSCQKNKLQNQLQDNPNKMNRSEAASIVLSFSDVIDNGNFDEIREVLFALIDKIELDGEDIDIFWKFE